MRTWDPEQVARASGARLIAPPRTRSGPERATIDSREAGPGALFVGLPGERAHGGTFAAQALAGHAWGVLTTPEHAQAAAGAPSGVLLAAQDPLAALQRLAAAWREDLGAHVIGVTGSTGKTSTKDLLLAVLAPHRATVASRANFNTEIGLPLEILAAPAGTEVLVLEMGMRGAGQIAELATIARPDVAIIVSVGPVHLELLGSIEAVAAAKAELIAGLRPGDTAVVPAGEPLLEPHLRTDVRTVTFGEHGDVRLVQDGEDRVVIDSPGGRVTLEVDFTQAHLRRNLLAAVAAAQAVGVTPGGRIDLALSPGRGQRETLPGGVTLIDDCYNANPMSMRAALDELAATAARLPIEPAPPVSPTAPASPGRAGRARRVAVLGDMLELGPDAERFHAELGAQAREAGVDVLVAVGPLAAATAAAFGGERHHVADAEEAAPLVAGLVRPGDVVLVKASRGVRLERVCEAVRAVGAIA
jgi:UDP-N-acetylmuramoyl-tripeptide--D-alanyl-D-alanine ligase